MAVQPKKVMMWTLDECKAENHAACPNVTESLITDVQVLCTCPCHHPISMKEFDLKEQYGN